MPFAIGGNQLDTGYEISNSLRFNEPDGAHLSRTPSSAGNRKTWTFSCWIKRSGLQADVGDFQAFFTAGSGSNRDQFFWEASNGHFDKLAWYGNYGGTAYGVRTSSVFRDVSAWYHVVWVGDTTQGTEANRLKVYINGTQQTLTEFNSGFLSQNTDMYFNNTTEHEIGSYTGETQHFAGYMSEINHIDGQALDPTYFAETNANGVWIPKEYTGSYGTNGFFMEFKQTGTSANSSGMGADTSGNDHHFTPSNLAATDVTTDTPTNNFATLNPLAVSRFDNDGVYSEGNTKITSTSNDNDRFYSVTTMGVTSGKWYWEIKVPTVSRVETGVGILTEIMGTSQHYNNETNPNIIGVNSGGNIYGKGGEDYDDHQNWAADLSANDIIMWALDMDNYELWYGINGTWQDSGDPTSGATGTGGIINETSNAYRTKLNHGDFIHAWVSDLSTSGQTAYEMNFGNPSFSISSGNSDANGYGNFEYAVPSGYYALCTKNLAEFG